MAALNSKGKLLGVSDAPVQQLTKRARRNGRMCNVPGKRIFVPTGMLKWLSGWPKDRVVVVGVEQVHAMPKQGVASMFNMGYGLGLWIGVITSLGLPLEMTTPQAWKKAMLVSGGREDKAVSLTCAYQCVPSAVPFLQRKKDEGRAEAILIAEYFRRKKSVV